MKKHAADYVNPYIGTISHMLVSTQPQVMLPYSYVKSCAKVHSCEDYYCNDYIDGFPVGGACIMPGSGNGTFENTIDHSREDFRCYYSRTELETGDIIAESTVTRHVYVYRFSGAHEILLTCPNGSIGMDGNDIRLCMQIHEKDFHAKEFVLLRFNTGVQVKRQTEGSWVFSVPGFCECYAAVSYISFDKAEQSLRIETGTETFDTIMEKARDVWDNLLGRIRIEGNSEDKQIVFYTALYRAFQRMTDYAEYGEYFSGYDGKVHNGSFFYTGDGLWDTFRCMHPLQLLLDPDRQKDIMESYNLMYLQSGLMPSFPSFRGDLPVMIGFHAAALFADALAKGVELDYKTAYEGIRKNALEQSMLPWTCNLPATELDRCYYEKGFFPALKKGEQETVPEVHSFERRQAMAVTLEHSYDDWCAAQLAKALGYEEDYRLFMQRSENYKNLYNREIGFMAPKSADGSWVEDFDPKWSGGMGGRDYSTENNTWTYTWSVLHDIDGLANLMGGKKEAEKRLDRLFCEGFRGSKGSKYVYLGQFPDSTGLMGQFAMGNEPSFHIPYLYDYFGCAWKAQKRLRDLMDIWFTNSPTGICGDEDGGAMSSWLVFSALGFYPVCPGKAEYAIGTPLFDKAELTLQNGRSFVIKSIGAGDGLRYIQEAVLNGRRLERPFLTHKDVTAGGELVLKMGARPVQNW